MGSCYSESTVVNNDNKPENQQKINQESSSEQDPRSDGQSIELITNQDLKDQSQKKEPQTFNRIAQFNYEDRDMKKNELFSYIKETFFVDWQIQAKNNLIQILINEELMQFEFFQKGSLNKEQFDHYIDFFSKKLDLLRGLKLKLQSSIETQAKFSLCQEEKFQSTFKQLGRIDTLKIINPKQHKNEKNVLIFIILLIETSTLQFKDILDQLIVKETVKEQIQFYGYSKQELKKVMKNLQQNYENIEIQWQIKEDGLNKFLNITYVAWNLKLNDQPSDISKVKSKIQETFQPLEIDLSDKTQQLIWNESVSALYGAGNEKYACQTKKNLSESKLVIELKGQKNTVSNIKQEIENKLQHYKMFPITLLCHFDCKIFDYFQKKGLQDLFKKSVKKIEESFKNCKVRILLDKLIQCDSNGKGCLSAIVIFDQQKYQIANFETEVENSFVKQLEIYHIQCQIPELLHFLALKDIIQLEEEYEVYVHRVKQEVYFIGLKEQIKQMKNFLNQISQMTNKIFEQGTINLVSNIIQKQIQILIDSKKILIPPDSKITYDMKLNLIIVCKKELLNQILTEIRKNIEQLEQQMVELDCKFNEKEIELLFKQNIQEIEKIENEFNCSIQEIPVLKHQQQKLLCLSELIYQNKTLALIQDDIANIRCDMIVNSCNQLLSFGNPELLSGVAKSISLFAGNQYQVFCQNFIKQNQELLLGETLIYELPPQSSIQYIINVVTPIYEHSENIQQNFASIQENIKSIFFQANNKRLKSLAIPLLGCGACGIAFKEAAAVIVNQIIDLFFSNNCRLEKIYIVELYEKRMNDLQEILQQQLHVVNQRSVQYQWQWLSDSSHYTDFDDLDINRQIDEAYEVFLNDGSKNQIQLKYSYSKQPGTHEVDLVQKKVKDLSVNHVQSLTSITKQNNKRFLLNDLEVDDTLNEYLILKEMLNETKFKIFLKEYKIIFNQNKAQIYQENIKTGYKRSIKFAQLDTKKYLQNQNILIGQQFQLKHYSNSQKNDNEDVQKIDDLKQLSIVKIYSLSQQINQNVEKALLSLLNQMVVQKEILVLNYFIDDLERFEFLIKKFVVKYEGQIECLSKIQIYIQKQYENEFMKELTHFEKHSSFYPPEWTKQDANMIKVQLSPTDPQYQDIEKKFRDTEPGTIHRIYRIQNKSLWENYMQEKKNLLKRYQGSNQLTQNEQERFLWHGVRAQHPQIIYEGEKEAFDPTYSNNCCMWGNGIYFAERANYSRGYSFTLNGQQDPDLSGKLVFLCCLVTTGRLEKRNPDNSIKRPSRGFDCVTGFTNGSDVYILYAMDVRRAYPAYEIIYQ